MSAIYTLRRLPFLSSEEEGFALFDLGQIQTLGRTFDAAVEVEDVMWMGSGVHTDSTLQVTVVFES